MPYLRSQARRRQESNLEPLASSTPTPSNSQNNQALVREATSLLQSLDINSSDKYIPVQNLSSLYDSDSDNSHDMPHQVYNKELAEIMMANIPKFDLNSTENPAMQLRSFIKACRNVLDLYTDNAQANSDFFKLIKFRLGYNVQERITKHDITTLQNFEDHLRSICHIKLNKGKLLTEIKNERQHASEDVSHFVERLRKLIAQGRSEYANDKEFEKEAIRTLKNSVKNELISIKLMDSLTDKFEELAEIAINRDSELHQRSYNTSNTQNSAPSNETQKILHELLDKIRNLENQKSATIQHIQHETRFRSNSPFGSRNPPQRPISISKFCNYCRRSGHDIKECRRRNSNNANRNRNRNFNNSHGYPQQNQYSNRNYQHNQNNYHNPPNTYNKSPNSYQNSPNNYGNSSNTYQNSPRPHTNNPNQQGPARCLRCNEEGHKSVDCFAIICSICRQIGHTNAQCNNSNSRRVHFHEGNDQNQQEHYDNSGN